MKYLIIGLGNPGAEYENTRHNIGFKVLDALVSASNTSFTTDRYADVAEIKFRGRNLVLIKPNTFMNLSGKAVNYWMQNTKIDIENMLVITDDISLPFGVLRMRKKGSDGGHNGLKDINSVIGDNNYARLRFGVGNDFPREARSIHYDKKTSKGIYGKTTPEEASELIEEGIEVATIPWVEKSEN